MQKTKTRVIMPQNKRSRMIRHMNKEYGYAPGTRAVWFILAPALCLFWLFFLWLAWAEPRSDTRHIFLFISLLTCPLLIWGILSIVFSTMRVRVQDTAVTLHLLNRTHTIPYDDITAVHQSQLFIVIKTRYGRCYIERSINQSAHLVAELKRRAPTLRRAAALYITNPLPRHLAGKPTMFLMGFGLFLLFAVMVFGMTQFNNEGGLGQIVGWLVALFCASLGLLLLYLTLFELPWRVTFASDQITLRCLLRQRRFATADLQTARVEQRMITHKGVTRPSYTMLLTFANGRTLAIQQDQIQQSLLEFLPVLEHHYQIQPMHHREIMLVPFRRFGTGSQNDFRWYFERESQVQTATVAEVCGWLQQCRYVSDQEQFNARDHWLHPVEFEVNRQGDCEDHALWAWRKLVELGLPAEFVVGQAKWADDHATEAHAWVTFVQDGRDYLLEATAKTNLLHPLESTASRYQPWYSIDQDFQTYQHNRYIQADHKLSPSTLLRRIRAFD